MSVRERKGENKMAVTKIAGALLIVGLVIGVVAGYIVAGFITYQPQISQLQSDLSETQSKLSEMESALSTSQSEVVSLQGQLTEAQDNIASLKKEISAMIRARVERVLDAVIEYIKENHPDAAVFIEEPLIWMDVSRISLVGHTTYIFRGTTGWNVTIGYPIVPPEDIIYEVTAQCNETAQCNGITWIGTVHQGVVSETSYEFLPGTPPIEPAPGTLSTQGYVYDDKLGYGFEYPGGWELYVAEDDFPDKNIKKVVSFEKKILKDGQFSVEIEFIVKSATDLQEVKNEFKKLLEMSGVPILNEATISVNNIDGYDILSGTPTWKLRQVVFFANGMAYIFKYSSQEEFYRMYEETFNNIINSFNINMNKG